MTRHAPSLNSSLHVLIDYSDVFPAVYHVTNQRPDELWSFQTQRSQSENFAKINFQYLTEYICHQVYMLDRKIWKLFRQRGKGQKRTKL